MANNGNQLAIIDGNDVFTIEEKSELEKYIDRTIAAHQNNRRDINRLVFECTAALTEADDASNELKNKGALRRFIGGITGSNKRLQDKINSNIHAAQYASQVTLQKLAEQNLMTFDLLTAVNNKLNASVDAINESMKKQFVILGNFILKNRGDIVSLSLRMNKAEKNISLLNWQSSIEYLNFNGVEYSELDDAGKIVCLARDFYDLTDGKWTTSDLLLLKAAMGQVGIAPKKEINVFDTLKTIADTPELAQKLLNDKEIQSIPDPSYLISLGTLEKLHTLNDKEHYAVDVMASTFKDNGIEVNPIDVRDNLAKEYMRQRAGVNLNTNVAAYDFMLELLYNLSEANTENLLQISTDNNEGLMRLFLTDHTEENYKKIQEFADDGNAMALYMMAVYCEGGYGVRSINNKSRNEYYKKSYEAGYPVAGYWVDAGPNHEILNEVKDKIRALAEAGDVFAQNDLGNMYYWGHGVEQSNEKAVEWYQKAAEQGYAKGQMNLGNMYDGGKGIEQSSEKAVEWYRKAAEQGNAVAQNSLGVMYCDGEGVEQSYKKALEWYQKAVEQGYALSQINLGDMYYNGNGVKQSYEKALEWYRKAAHQGYARAQNNIGEMYYKGKGVKFSWEKAVEWYRKAVEQGYAAAQFNLGFMYCNGFGVEKSYEKAVEWYRKSAEQGYAKAQWSLGNMYCNGWGVEKSYEKALEWYRKSAEQGYADAQMSLSRMYTYGRGVERSVKKALEWLQKAVDQGDAEAECDLGTDYYFGFGGVSQNIAKARELLQKSAAQGNEYAKDFLQSHHELRGSF